MTMRHCLPKILCLVAVLFGCLAATGDVVAQSWDWEQQESLRKRISDLVKQRKYKEAEPLAQRYFSNEKAAKEPYALASAHQFLGGFYLDVGQYDKADSHLQQALKFYKDLSYSTEQVADRLLDLRIIQKRYTDALGFYRQVLEAYQRLMGRSAYGWTYLNFANVAYRVAQEKPEQEQLLAREAFTHAQRTRLSTSAISLAQMAARGSKGDPAIASLVRQLQDLSSERSKLYSLDLAASNIAPDKRDHAARAANLKRLISVETELNTIEKRFSTGFPEYNDLVRAMPLTIEEAQANLSDDEALVLLLDTPSWSEIFLWVITKAEVRWVRTELEGLTLSDAVRDLRCGLDASMWEREEVATNCSASLNAAPTRDQFGNVLMHTLPFDLSFAHFLYAQLFGEVVDLIAGKHLLIVPSDAFSQLPFHVLVTELDGADLSGLQQKAVSDLGVDLEALNDQDRKQSRVKRGVKLLERLSFDEPLTLLGKPAGWPKGLEKDDILLSINGKDVRDVASALDMIQARAVGTKVTLGIWRKGKEKKVVAVLVSGYTGEVTPKIFEPGKMRDVAWLGRSHPITILPSVSALKALRGVAKPSFATKPMIGIGNPLLDGNPRERPWEADWVAKARAKQACVNLPDTRVAGRASMVRGVLPAKMRGGIADLGHLRIQAPLPDTADELCAAAAALKMAPEDVLLGANATETAVKALSASGELAKYRVVHFATHGTLAGEIENTTEPGLILTPPAEQTQVDDGYLSASEIMSLKLDADWVILSACNTSAGGAKDSEALSGLARAFIYAGARALLVSHWAVDSEATVKLVTAAVDAITSDQKIGRAEAMRLAMQAMFDSAEPHHAHPAMWAPFQVVGEGSTR